MAELADAHGSGPCTFTGVLVRLQPRAPTPFPTFALLALGLHRMGRRALPVNLNLVKDIKNAYQNLKPGNVRHLAEKRVSIGLLTSTAAKKPTISASSSGQTESIVERVTESAPAGKLRLAFGRTELSQAERGVRVQLPQSGSHHRRCPRSPSRTWKSPSPATIPHFAKQWSTEL